MSNNHFEVGSAVFCYILEELCFTNWRSCLSALVHSKAIVYLPRNRKLELKPVEALLNRIMCLLSISLLFLISNKAFIQQGIKRFVDVKGERSFLMNRMNMFIYRLQSKILKSYSKPLLQLVFSSQGFSLVFSSL